MGGNDIQQAQRKQIMEYTVILLLVTLVEHRYSTRCQNVIYWPGIFKDVEKIVCTLY